jgi:hypothetical protein
MRSCSGEDSGETVNDGDGGCSGAVAVDGEKAIEG